MSAKKSVLVLNAGYERLHAVSLEKAVRMIMRGVAIIEEHDPERTFGPFPYPLSLRLLKYISMDWYYSAPLIWSKSGVLRRDDRQCAYYGSNPNCTGNATTIDHVLPVSKGGKSTWENTVASCRPCNAKKDNKSLQEIGWVLDFQPKIPRRDQLISSRR